MQEAKKLYRSRTNRMVSGVCGGIAQYFNVDPSLVRIIAGVLIPLTALSGVFIAYLFCALVVPEEPI